MKIWILAVSADYEHIEVSVHSTEKAALEALAAKWLDDDDAALELVGTDEEIRSWLRQTLRQTLDRIGVVFDLSAHTLVPFTDEWQSEGTE